jgi:50S ribosomal subunit-associated GTPase HflX
LFIISLSDYNQVLLEDNTTNRMRESEKLFKEILNCIFFKRTAFIVFFNKVDLFRQKLNIDRLNNYYEEYLGSGDFQDAM